MVVQPPTLGDVAAWEALSGGVTEATLKEFGIVDGLPFATAITRAQVEEALRTVGLGAEDVIANVPPLSMPATAGSLAICALLAGCEPAHFPVVVAAIRAVAEPPFNGMGVLTTTGTAAVAVIVSGPAARDFNSGPNLLGPGNRANAAVGRAVALAARVVGGSMPGFTDMATMGQPGKYTFCFAELEDQNPWGPFHVERGLDASQSAVTVFAASGTVESTNMYAKSADDVLDTMAASLYLPGTIDFDGGLTGGGRCVAIVSPDWAALLSQGGMSRSDVAKQLAARACWPASILPPGLRAPLEREDRTDPPSVIRAVESPEDIILVVGGGVGTKQTVIPCWPGGSRAVTVPL